MHPMCFSSGKRSVKRKQNWLGYWLYPSGHHATLYRTKYSIQIVWFCCFICLNFWFAAFYMHYVYGYSNKDAQFLDSNLVSYRRGTIVIHCPASKWYIQNHKMTMIVNKIPLPSNNVSCQRTYYHNPWKWCCIIYVLHRYFTFSRFLFPTIRRWSSINSSKYFCIYILESSSRSW